VPTPNSVHIFAIDAQIVSQSLTLECNVTTVRGITSRVDIVWSSNGLELKRNKGANVSFISDGLVIYTDYYDTLQLNTSDNGRVYQCEVFVNTSPSITANGIIRLDLNGQYAIRYNT